MVWRAHCPSTCWGEMCLGVLSSQVAQLSHHQCRQRDVTCSSDIGMLGSNPAKGFSRDMLVMGHGDRGLVSKLCHSLVPPTPQSNQEQSLQQKLLDQQFGILQEAVREAEDILRDAVAKLDDPLHVRCTSSPGMSPLTTGVATCSPFSLQDG